MKQLKEKRGSSVVRQSTVLPRRLVEEATAIAPPELRQNFNRLVKTALELYVEVETERRIAQDFIEMGKDPHVIADCRRINAEFAQTEGDGLGP